jgi:serine/threonine protein kinase
MVSKVIGEGSYGCVHKPSLHCINPPNTHFSYKNYISKIMETKYAKEELDEFIVIGNMDPTDEYHLGEPILCKPNLSNKSLNSINKCKEINVNEVKNEPDNYSLLIMRYGGPDLKDFINKHLDTYFKKNKEKRLDNLLLEFHHLLRGLQFFKKNKIVHNDIKPQNILIREPHKPEICIIDFGLSTH